MKTFQRTTAGSKLFGKFLSIWYEIFYLVLNRVGKCFKNRLYQAQNC